MHIISTIVGMGHVSTIYMYKVFNEKLWEILCISKIHLLKYTGVLLSESQVINEPTSILKLWVHEVMRVYYDRLVDDSDRAWVVKFLKQTTQENFNMKFDELFAHLDFNKDGVVEEDDLRSLMFCDFVDPKNDQKPYAEVQDVDKLRLVVENYLDEYNNISKKPMNLVMFR